MPSDAELSQVPVIRQLYTIHKKVAYACDSAPKGMAERWAKEYAASRGSKSAAHDAGGASLRSIVECCDAILSSWREIPGTLPDTSGVASAQDIYNAFDTAVDEYWAIIRRTAEGLRLPGTQQHIGAQFESLFETHRDAFRDAAPKVVAATESLGKEKHAKMQEWVDRTGPKFEDAINAAKGN
ncbi:hypothetical protein Q7P35_008725 [Cladosporium inversicolor]